MEQLIENGGEEMASFFADLLNLAMRRERFLRAGQRSAERRFTANGAKPKKIDPATGEVRTGTSTLDPLRHPEACGGEPRTPHLPSITPAWRGPRTVKDTPIGRRYHAVLERSCPPFGSGKRECVFQV